MKKILNLLIIFVILNITSIIATPNRSQFKPLSIELDNECIAVISCRLIDYKGDCLKTDLIVNTPNGYTSPIDINEQQTGDKAIKLLAVSPIENGLAVATYNEKGVLGLAQYVYDLNAKTLNRVSFIEMASSPEQAVTLDLSSRSSILAYNNNNYFIVLSTETDSYFITADESDFIYTYKVTDVVGSTNIQSHKLDYIAGNEEGTFTVVSYNRNCTASNISINLLYFNVDINTKIINVNAYSYSNPVCPDDRKTMLRYVSSTQILFTTSFQNTSTVALLNFPNSISFSNTRHKMAPRDVQILPVNFTNSFSSTYLSSLTFDYSSINFRSTFSTFYYDGTDAILSVERCCYGCYKNCLIEGHFLDLDLNNNLISRKSDTNGSFVDLPVVPSSQLGFDRIRFDDSFPLFRYNILCMRTDLQ